MTRKEGNEDLEISSKFFSSIVGDENDFDSDNISFVDFGSKEDEIFTDIDKLSLTRSPQHSESVDIDETKIYQDELKIKLNTDIEEIVQSRKELEKKGAFSETIDNTVRVDLNSDVGNDICLENIKKIHSYLDSDEKQEKLFSATLEKYRSGQMDKDR